MAGSLAAKLGSVERQKAGSISISGAGEYRLSIEISQQWALYEDPAADQNQPQDAPALDAVVASARKAPKLTAANPVFVDPESQLWMIATEQIIVRLRPETDPRRYFGAKWPAVRRIPGTTDQFVLSLSTSKAEDVLTEVNRHAGDPRVLWAEPDFITEELRHENDTYFADQWHLNNTGQTGARNDADIDASEAWQTTTGSQMVIAVLDDGFELNHPDLSPNIFSPPGEIAGNGIDDDLNGYIDDVRGWDFARNDNDPSPFYSEDSHGTATAGVAAAAGNNGIGIVGSAYSSKILPIRIYGTTPSARAAAIYYAGGRTRDGLGRWRGADVLSVSLGWPKSQADFDAFKWAAKNGRGGKGCSIFVATGNFGSGWYTLSASNIDAGTHTFRFEYIKDGSLSAGEDTVWLDDITFPDGERESFEGTFPPAGWTMGGSAQWTQETRHDHVRGTGIRSARSGRISDFQTTYLQTTRSVSAGTLSLWAWTSTERNFDVLNVYVDGILVETDPGGVNAWKNGTVSYPATHPDVIGVGASTDFDYRSDYSQFGPGLDIVAPSSGGLGYVFTADRLGSDGYAPGDYYLRFGGTSASCPLAAGVGALLLSVNQCLSPVEVANLLQGSCDKIGGLPYTQGYNTYYGYGRLNAARALANTQPYQPALNLATWNVPASATTTNVTLNVLGAGCTWYVTNSCSWVTPSRLSGKGLGAVGLSVRANLDCVPRTCTLTIAGQPLTVNQAASTGAFTLSPTNWTAPWNGGTKIATIRPAGAGCSWDVVNPCSDWLQVTPTSGSDTGAVTIVAATNSTALTRSCDLVIAGKRLRVTQGPAAILNFGRAVFTNRESDRAAVIRVVRSGAVKRAITVDVITQDGTATSPDDYRARTNRLRMASGLVATNVSFTLVNDTAVEDSENFQVVLANPVSAILGAQSVTSVLLLDNDVSSGGLAAASRKEKGLSEARLSCSVTRLANGDCELQLQSEPGVIEVQASEDLVRWQTVATLTNQTGEVRWRFTPTTKPAQFYHALRRGDP